MNKLEMILKEEFDPMIRSRGASYFHEKRIRLINLENATAEFEVSGTQKYFVSIKHNPHAKLDGEGIDFVLSCTCAEFEEGELCKHIWAATLEVDRADLLEKITGRAGGLATVSVLKTWQDEVARIEGALKRQTEALSIKRPKTAKSRNSKIGVYVIEIDPSVQRNQVCLDLYSKERLKKGGFSILKNAELSHLLIENYEDPVEREFLWDLVGRTELSTSLQIPQAQSLMKVNSVTITSGHADLILRKISHSQKLFVRKQKNRKYFDRISEEEISTYSYLNEVWNLQMKVDQTSPEHYSLSGILMNEQGQTRPLNQVVQTIDHFVFFQDSISRSDLSHGKLWLELLRNGPIKVPIAELPSFLEFFWRESQAKIPIELPKEIQFQEITGLQPKVQLFFQTEKEAAQIAAKVQFNYNEKICMPDGGHYIYDLGNQTKIERNLEFEKDTLETLNEFHPLPSEDPSVQGFFTNESFLPAAEKALSIGWEVFAKDQRVSIGKSFEFDLSSGLDWFDVGAQFHFEGQTLKLPQLLHTLRTGGRMVNLGNGVTGLLPEEWLRRFAPLISMAQPTETGFRLNKLQALFLSSTFEAHEKFTEDSKFKNLRMILNDLKNLSPTDCDPKFTGELRDYQKKGLGWLSILADHEIGGILADDMGLGKTIQVLAMLSLQKATKLKGDTSTTTSLVLAPKSLIYNWQAESEKFTTHLKTLIYSGVERHAHAKKIQDYDVVITTYQTLRNDVAHFQNINFNFLILDEAHFVKNSQSQINIAARTLKARKRFALTGTPVENSLMDLFSILSIVTPGLVSESLAQKWVKQSDQDTLTKLAKALHPFILRRTKEQVLKDLPEKSEQVLYCELSDSERRKYDELKAYYWANLSEKFEQKGLARTKIEVLEALLRLRQAACHQGLLADQPAGLTSSKFELLLEQLESIIHDGHKVLIFSQFTSLLALLKSELDKKHITYEYLDGQTIDRAERVQNFQSNPSIPLFLLSLKAGGVGLNLTAADYVFILDPWWNPAAEAQAIDRTHRIGQTKKVFAYKIIAKDTVEEKILDLQRRKKEIAKAIIAEDASLLKSMELEDLRELFQ